jgi:hypothetical protein
MMARLVILIIFIASSFASTAAAQQSTPVSEFQKPERPEELLFPAEELGEGWFLVDPVVTQVVNTDTWEAAATAVYAGPEGQRVGVAIRYVVNDRAAILAVEDVLDRIFYVYEQYDLTTDGEIELPSVPPCDSMRRIEGSNRWWQTTGSSSCLIGLDLVIWVEVQGDVLGNSGVEASDRVIGLLLS